MVTADGNVDDPNSDMGSLTTKGMSSSWLRPTQKTLCVQSMCNGKKLADDTLLSIHSQPTVSHDEHAVCNILQHSYNLAQSAVSQEGETHF